MQYEFAAKIRPAPVQFAQRKIPSIAIHSLNQESWNARILHSSKDKLCAMNLDHCYEKYRLVAAYVTCLDQFSNAPAKPASH